MVKVSADMPSLRACACRCEPLEGEAAESAWAMAKGSLESLEGLLYLAMVERLEGLFAVEVMAAWTNTNKAAALISTAELICLLSFFSISNELSSLQ